jgi:hypothetical protein
MARPDQPSPDVINDRGIRIEDGLFEVLQIGVIQVELALEGAIRDTAQALEHRDGLCQDLLECHRCPSIGLDACRTRLLWPIVSEDVRRLQAWQHRKDRQERQHNQRLDDTMPPRV